MAVNGNGVSVLQRRIVRSTKTEGRLGLSDSFCVLDAAAGEVRGRRRRFERLARGGGGCGRVASCCPPLIVTTTHTPTHPHTHPPTHPPTQPTPQVDDMTIKDLWQGPAGLHSFGQIAIGDANSPCGVLLVGKQEVTDFGRAQ
jgi:hypothetical protein